MNIAIDIFGGDHAPREVARGIAHFLKDHIQQDMVLFLVGIEEQVEQLIYEFSISNAQARVIHAPSVIPMQESSTDKFLSLHDSSLFTGIRLLKEGVADILITAGNSAALVTALVANNLVTDRNIRCCAPVAIPQFNGATSMLLDAGLNINCTPGQLVAFAKLATDHSRRYLKIAEPRVGLINIGTEKNKGPESLRLAYDMLQQDDKINFVGNIEGHEILNHSADILLCDGFTGNIILKLLESFGAINPAFNFEQYGGSVLIGTEKPVILGHGRSSAMAYTTMLKQAVDICLR